ncbi:MAG TPA: succinyldiaminopimelate transaminase [Rhodocyclaceae bacterium]|nr:succinyldiaminopimelate transaminase [Rhodocyclaceae bacterium]
MNPHLAQLNPYPFERLRRLFEGIAPPPGLPEIKLSIGEPQHETPAFIKQALVDALGGLASYPSTQGTAALRAAIAAWIGRRYGVAAPDPETQVLPVNGSREALFAFAQTVIDPARPGALVLCPNPFYQIYEGAAILAGATPVFVATRPENGFELDLDALSEDSWRRVQLVYLCSPGNPTGKVLAAETWNRLFALSDRYGFVIASDECYSEIYFAEERPPLGALQAAQQAGRGDYRNLLVFSSLSKRSNVPGMRSGFVAGDAALIKNFLLYRTYHGGAMSPAVQAASIAAWSDEAHVVDNRRRYREKFEQIAPQIAAHLDTRLPDAGFYLWAGVSRYGIGDAEFARELKRQYNVAVLPGSYLGRDSATAAGTSNPGAGFIRIALVAEIGECREAARRIADFCRKL